MSTSDLVIVIVTFNSARFIDSLLDSIPAALDALSADVVIVDSGSADETASIVLARGDCRFVQSENRGFSAAVNRGVRESTCRGPILVLNADVRLASGSIPTMRRALADPGIGIVVPRLHTYEGKVQLSLRREPTLLRNLGLARTKLAIFAEHLMNIRDYDRPRIVDWAQGAVVMIHRACYEELGGWDESYFLYSEDTDFCMSARDRSFATKFEPLAVAEHFGGGSGYDPELGAMMAVNRVRFYRRRHGVIMSSVYLAFTCFHEVIRLRPLDLKRGGPSEHMFILRALLFPRRRPTELRCSDRLLPR